MIVYPNAKINIGLNVIEKRKDGYHNIETVFYPVNLMDALEIVPSVDLCNNYNIKVSGEILGGRPEDNLVVKAFNALKLLYPDKILPVDIHLHKHIPTGAGLGGGSSDAANTIIALNQKFSLGLNDQEMEIIASKIGADCPFFIKNKPVFATGTGDVFSNIDINLKGKYIIIVKPNISVSTQDAYSEIIPKCPVKKLPELLSLPLDTWKDNVVNDFETTVFKKYPEIAAIKDKLYDLGALYATMSGSGSAVYGIFNKQINFIDEIFAGYFCRQREMEY